MTQFPHLGVLQDLDGDLLALGALDLGLEEAVRGIRHPAGLLAIEGCGLFFEQLLPVDDQVLEVGVVHVQPRHGEVLASVRNRKTQKKCRRRGSGKIKTYFQNSLRKRRRGETMVTGDMFLQFRVW